MAVPWEILEPMGMAFVGWKLKMDAQKQSHEAANWQMALKGLGAHNISANQATGRESGGGAVMRRWIIGFIFFVSFGGILLAMWGDYTVGYLFEVPVKEHFLGLFKTGGKMKEIVSGADFVITPYMRRITIDAAFFLFGSGVAKQRR